LDRHHYFHHLFSKENVANPSISKDYKVAMMDKKLLEIFAKHFNYLVDKFMPEEGRSMSFDLNKNDDNFRLNSHLEWIHGKLNILYSSLLYHIIYQYIYLNYK